MSKRIIPLLHDSDPNVRESAVKIAGYFGYPEAATELLELCGDPIERVRCAAIEHLPFLEDDRAGDVLSRVIKKDTPNVRAAAARALGNIDSPDAAARLIEALEDDDVWVRYFSARALGRRRAAESIAALEKVVAKEEFNHVRIAALDSLGQMGDVRVAEIVGDLVRDDDPDLARAAKVAMTAAQGNTGFKE